MSQKSRQTSLPPFLQQSGSRKRGRTAPATTSATPPEQVAIQKVQDPPSVVENQLPKVPSKQPSPKRPVQDGPPKEQLPPPPASSSRVVTATPTQHLFGGLGTKYSEGEEATKWWTADPDENSQAVSKCLAEAFIRQAAHSKSFAKLSASHAEQKKKIQRLEWQIVQDKRSLEETHKQNLRETTAQLRTDLKNVRKERNDLDAKLKVAEEAAKKQEEEIAKLKADLDAAKQELNASEDVLLVKGQVAFMKEFIRTIPDFDWDRLGPGNAEFAEGLKKDIAEEDAAEEARLAEEAKVAEEARIAEEARLAEEAAKAQQDNTAA